MVSLVASGDYIHGTFIYDYKFALISVVSLHYFSKHQRTYYLVIINLKHLHHLKKEIRNSIINATYEFKFK